jgi:hypothetical protein
MSLFSSSSEGREAPAPHAWYADVNQDQHSWKQRFTIGSGIDEKLVSEVFETHRSWVESAGLKHSATFFLNGRGLPKEFRLADL